MNYIFLTVCVCTNALTMSNVFFCWGFLEFEMTMHQMGLHTRAFVGTSVISMPHALKRCFTGGCCKSKCTNNHTRTHTEYQSCFQQCRSWIRLTWRCPPLRRTNLGWCPSGVRGVIHKCTSSNRIMALVNQPQIPQKTYGDKNALRHAQTM